MAFQKSRLPNDGLVVGSLLLSEWLVLCLAPILRHAKPNAWIAAVVFAIAGFAVALYWGYWWKRQNNFFSVPVRWTHGYEATAAMAG